MTTENIFKQKQALRKELKAQRRRLSEHELANISKKIVANIENTEELKRAEIILAYYSMSGEVQLNDFLRRWIGKKQIYLPVVAEEKMVFRRYTHSTKFVTSAFGVQEPLGDDFDGFDKIDLVIAPGLAFDRNMNRMGYGKGFYDRFFKENNVFKMATSFDFQIVDQVPVDHFDVKMDMIVTESEIIR